MGNPRFLLKSHSTGPLDVDCAGLHRTLVSQHTLEAAARSAPPSPVSDPLAALRLATQEQHARLDAGLPIARPHATLADYAAHAAALHAWLSALAPELQWLTEREPRFAPDTTHRLQALQADLQDAGHGRHDADQGSPSAATQAQVRHALQRTPDTQDAVRWGMAYVVEGSQLGGQVMHRQLAPRLTPHPLRYLRGRGPETGAHWKHFIALLRDHITSPEATAAACAGARAAFAGLEQHLHDQERRT